MKRNYRVLIQLKTSDKKMVIDEVEGMREARRLAFQECKKRLRADVFRLTGIEHHEDGSSVYRGADRFVIYTEPQTDEE